MTLGVCKIRQVRAVHVLVGGLLGVGQANAGEGWNVHPTLQNGSFVWGRVKINDQVPT